MAKIDIILPTYNQCEFIDRSIPAILNQTFCDFCFIIVNDGSSDKTEEYLKKYFIDKRIKYHKHLNKGLPYSLNKGHEIGDSEYCTWISTDNISKKNQLEVLYNHISNHDCDFVHSDFHKVKNGKYNYVDMKNKKGRLGIGNIGASFLYKRSVWNRFKYDEAIHGAEDIKFYAQIVLSGLKICHLGVSLVDYYCQDNSISRKMGREKIENLVNQVKKELGL